MALGIREVNGFSLDQLVHLLVIVVSGVEGRESNNHLVGKDSDGPPIHRERMALLCQYFRCEVIRCATEREGLGIALQNFGESKIGQTNVAVFVHKNVFRFEVSINDMLIMEMSDGHRHLNSIEFCAILSETLGVSEMHKKFTTADKPHDEENLLVRHKNIAHSHEKRMISLQQNILLQFC
jgi:hypothetical protein